MISEKKELTEQEWALFEIMHSSKDFSEFFIPNPPLSAHAWDGTNNLKLRLYQIPLISFEYNLVYDDQFSQKENFNRRKALGDIVGRGGRVYGKSFILIDDDCIKDSLLHPGEEHLLMAEDEKHLDPRFDFLADMLEGHKFFRLFLLGGRQSSINRSTKVIELKNGHKTFGRISGQKNPGSGFLGLHPHRKTTEEAQMISDVAFSKQIDSKSEAGCVERMSGVPDGRRNTPFHDAINKKSKKVIWYTSEVNPFWDKEEKKRKIEEHNGEFSHAYQTNVLGNEGDVSQNAWDLDDIRNCMTNHHVKLFEVSRKNYKEFITNPTSIVNIVPDETSEFTIIASDIGKSSPSECGIFCLHKGKWHLLYRIKVTGLVYDQQALVFHNLAEIMRANIIALDASEGLGDSIKGHLINEKEPEFIGKEYSKRVKPYYFYTTIITDYKKSLAGEILYDDKGNPLEIKQHIDEFAWVIGTRFFKDGKFELQDDIELLEQFSAEIAVKNPGKTVFQSKSPNHIISMMKVFFMANFDLEEKLNPRKSNAKPFLGVWLS